MVGLSALSLTNHPYIYVLRNDHTKTRGKESLKLIVKPRDDPENDEKGFVINFVDFPTTSANQLATSDKAWFALLCQAICLLHGLLDRAPPEQQGKIQVAAESLVFAVLDVSPDPDWKHTAQLFDGQSDPVAQTKFCLKLNRATLNHFQNRITECSSLIVGLERKLESYPKKIAAKTTRLEELTTKLAPIQQILREKQEIINLNAQHIKTLRQQLTPLQQQYNQLKKSKSVEIKKKKDCEINKLQQAIQKENNLIAKQNENFEKKIAALSQQKQRYTDDLLQYEIERREWEEYKAKFIAKKLKQLQKIQEHQFFAQQEKKTLKSQQQQKTSKKSKNAHNNTTTINDINKKNITNDTKHETYSKFEEQPHNEWKKQQHHHHHHINTSHIIQLEEHSTNSTTTTLQSSPTQAKPQYKSDNMSSLRETTHIQDENRVNATWSTKKSQYSHKQLKKFLFTSTYAATRHITQTDTIPTLLPKQLNYLLMLAEQCYPTFIPGHKEKLIYFSHIVSHYQECLTSINTNTKQANDFITTTYQHQLAPPYQYCRETEAALRACLTLQLKRYEQYLFNLWSTEYTTLGDKLYTTEKYRKAQEIHMMLKEYLNAKRE